VTTSEKYLLSFTAAGLMINESIRIAEEYIKLGDWDSVNQAYKERNLLQSRTTSRSQRVFQEIKKRLRILSKHQIQALVDGSIEEQKQILWFVACKRYQFIREFAVEVVHEKFLSMKSLVEDLDFDGFFVNKADWHPELNEITESTKTKLRTVLFRMLREAGILSDDHRIIPSVPSTRVVELIRNDGTVGLEIFPMYIEKLGE
jgi:hypothetical protein